MRPTLLAASWPGLFALATGFAATGCQNHIGIRGDIGLPVRPAVATATFGVGASHWNDRHRVALNALGASRPAGDNGIGALLFELEYDAFFNRRVDDDGASRAWTNELAFVGRVAAGPVFRDGSAMLEASLGLGPFGHKRTNDYEHEETRHDVFGVAVEAFVTRTYGVDAGGWLVGGRLSFALAGRESPFPHD